MDTTLLPTETSTQEEHSIAANKKHFVVWNNNLFLSWISSIIDGCAWVALISTSFSLTTGALLAGALLISMPVTPSLNRFKGTVFPWIWMIKKGTWNIAITATALQRCFTVMQHFYAPETIAIRKVSAFIQTSKINHQLLEIDHVWKAIA